MDIHDLLNKAGDEEWEFESDVDEEEEEDTNESADCEEGTETETDTASEAAVARPATQRKLTGNSYVDGIIYESGLHIIRPAEVDRAYKERGELVLSSLVFTREFCDSLQSWTYLLLKEKGKSEATVFDIDAYTGLEIVMSIIPLTCITAFYYRDTLTFSSISVRSALDAVCAAASGDADVQTRLKKNRTITYLDKLELP